MGEGKTIEHLERHRLRCLNQLNFVSAFLILFAVSEKKIAKSWKRRKRLEVRGTTKKKEEWKQSKTGYNVNAFFGYTIDI